MQVHRIAVEIAIELFSDGQYGRHIHRTQEPSPHKLETLCDIHERLGIIERWRTHGTVPGDAPTSVAAVLLHRDHTTGATISCRRAEQLTSLGVSLYDWRVDIKWPLPPHQIQRRNARVDQLTAHHEKVATCPAVHLFQPERVGGDVIGLQRQVTQILVVVFAADFSVNFDPAARKGPPRKDRCELVVRLLPGSISNLASER